MENTPKVYTFTLTGDEGDIILFSLRKAPIAYDVSAPLMTKILEQAAKQNTPTEPENPDKTSKKKD